MYCPKCSSEDFYALNGHQTFCRACKWYGLTSNLSAGAFTAEADTRPLTEPVKMTGTRWAGNQFDKVEVQEGLDAHGRKVVRTRRPGTYKQSIGSDFGDGQREHFETIEYKWSEWVLSS